jgi:hypothetical protein
VFRWVCALAVLALPAMAEAASITIRIELAGTVGPGQYAYNVIADLEPGARLGALSLVTAGFTSLSLNTANPGISTVDSYFVPNVFGDDRGAFTILNVANGVAIATGPTSSEILGTLFSPYQTGLPESLLIPLGVFADPAYFGGAVYDDNLVPVSDAIVVQVANGDYQFPPEWVHPTVPEPSAVTALAAAALLALCAARQLPRRRLGQ